MGREKHRNEFITDSTKRKKQYKQRVVTIMRKRYELEVMCGAKIQIIFIRGESNTPNLEPCEEPADDEDERGSSGMSMHGAAWYQDTKPKNSNDYYKASQKKLKLNSQLEFGNTDFSQRVVLDQTYSQAIFSPRTQAGSHQLRPSSPVAVAATWFSPPPQQDAMQNLTNDDAFSQLFPTISVPVTQVTTSPKKYDDDFFGKQYKDMFASRTMFGSANNNMFSVGPSPLFKPPSPTRDNSSLLTTTHSRQPLLGYSPTYNSAQVTGSMRVPSPRPECGNLPLRQPLLGYCATDNSEQVSVLSSRSDKDNLLLPDLFFGTSPTHNSAQVTSANPTLSPRPDYSNILPPNLFFGTSHRYDVSGAFKAPTRESPKSSSSKRFAEDNDD